MNLAPSPLDIFCKSLRHEGSNRIVLPDEADNPVSGEWIRAQMNDEVESALNKDLKEKVKKMPSLSCYTDELILRTHPRGGLLGDDRLYRAFQDWRRTALLKLWRLLSLESTRPIHSTLAALQKELTGVECMTASSSWLVTVAELSVRVPNKSWILGKHGPYLSLLNPQTSPKDKTSLTDSLQTWLNQSIYKHKESFTYQLVTSFPNAEWTKAVEVERDYHRTYLASLLYEWAWPEQDDPPAAQPELVRLLTQEPMQAEIREGEFGQSVDESWMQIVDYAVVDLPTGRLVRMLRPGLLVAGRVVRKAHVVISR